MPELKISPKLQELCKWKHIEEVNKRLDQGDTPNSVWQFINQNGLKISRPLIYDYAKMRKKALVDGLNIEHMLGISTRPLVDKSNPATKSTMNKLKSEIDALDKIIEGGYNTLLDWADRPIAPKTMMEAIKLKAELTDGNHGFLTNYGMERLREIEQGKYQLLMEHLISYIPEDKQQEAIDKLDELEDSYYRTTEYYEDYLRAKGYSDQDIERILKEVETNDEEEKYTEDIEQEDEEQEIKRTPIISGNKPVRACKVCGKLQPIDKSKSNNNWNVYDTNTKCECGGEYGWVETNQE